jgi:predicted ABC-type ATPase
MMKLINVRGCNGSGKTTALRLLATLDPQHLVRFETVPDHNPIPVTFLTLPSEYPNCFQSVAIIGDYSAQRKTTTAGLDCIKTQAAAKAVIELVRNNYPHLAAIFFEGVVVSTIYGPWHEWSKDKGGMVWVFLDTPIDICLSRIQERNGGKPIKEDQVMDKFTTIARVRRKVIEQDWKEVVYDLNWKDPVNGLLNLLNCGAIQ